MRYSYGLSGVGVHHRRSGYSKDTLQAGQPLFRSDNICP